jgi:hypothetical protein
MLSDFADSATSQSIAVGNAARSKTPCNYVPGSLQARALGLDGDDLLEPVPLAPNVSAAGDVDSPRLARLLYDAFHDHIVYVDGRFETHESATARHQRESAFPLLAVDGGCK